MTTDVDEEGWSYSFSFSPAFAWHGNHVWFHSFVRRRRWLRKRVKLPEHLQRRRGVADPGDDAQTERSGHKLNTDYFTIHSKGSWYADPNRRKDGKKKRRRRTKTGDEEAKLASDESGGVQSDSDDYDDENGEIENISMLLKAIKRARLDREKVEAIMSFVMHGGEELQYLPDHVSPSSFAMSRLMDY